MKEGPFAGSADRARFDREVQILGQLNHPNIIAVHDTGVAAGCHYFVMDYVSGQPLDVAMAGREWTINETLKLFGRICDAVNAAHLRGVIHRDLKPSNIRIDSDGEPHVLDFGLAKVAVPMGAPRLSGVGDGSSDAGPDMMTQTGQFVGSLPWASPEQAEGAPGKIDVRTDVYALGVILFQMLTGRFPYGVIGNMRDVIDNILTAEPVRPSTLRREGGRLARHINDEVETITLKCLQKERERRYQTAGELARDVTHYLAGEPIEAKRDSFAYVFRKQLKRYKLPVAVAAAFALVVIAGLVASLTFWRQAAQERDDAERARSAEEKQREVAEAINRFLNDELLAAVAPSAEKGQGRDVTMKEVLDATSERLEGRFEDQPHVEAGIRETLANTYWKLSKYAQAQPHLERALELYRREHGDEHEHTLSTMMGLAGLYRDRGDYERSESLMTQVLGSQRRVLGDQHWHTLESLGHLAALYSNQGRYDEAADLYAEALAGQKRTLGPQHSLTLSTMQFLGFVYGRLGRNEDGLDLLVESLEIQRRTLGPEHPDTLAGVNALAGIELELGHYDEAERLYTDALEIQTRVLGEEHVSTLETMGSLSTCYTDCGRYDDAKALLMKALEIGRRAYGNEHPCTLQFINNLAGVYGQQGRFDQAEPLMAELVEIAKRVLGPNHPNTAVATRNLASVRIKLEKYEDAEPLLLGALESCRRQLGEEHPSTLRTMFLLGVLYGKLNRNGQAEEQYTTSIGLARQALAEGHPKIGWMLMEYGSYLTGLEQYVKAEKALVEAHQIRSAAFGSTHEFTIEVIDSLVDLHDAWHAAEPGQGHAEKAAEWRAKLPSGP